MAQRQEYQNLLKGKTTRLDQMRIRLLNSVGFAWQLQRGGRRRRMRIDRTNVTESDEELLEVSAENQPEKILPGAVIGQDLKPPTPPPAPKTIGKATHSIPWKVPATTKDRNEKSRNGQCTDQGSISSGGEKTEFAASILHSISSLRENARSTNWELLPNGAYQFLASTSGSSTSCAKVPRESIFPVAPLPVCNTVATSTSTSKRPLEDRERKDAFSIGSDTAIQDSVAFAALELTRLAKAGGGAPASDNSNTSSESPSSRGPLKKRHRSPG